MSKTVKILGTGCPKCKATSSIINEIVEQYKVDAKVEKVEDIMEIMNYDVISTPAVVVDDKVVIKGKVPNREEIFEIFDIKVW